MKSCPKCKKQTGNRSLKCRECNHVFSSSKKKVAIKKKKKKEQEETKKIRRKIKKAKKLVPCKDWKSLKKDQVIKVVQGHGPHYVADNKVKYQLNEHGWFIVKDVLDEGLLAYSKKNLTTVHYIYMLDEKRQMPSGSVYEPHKILCKNSDLNPQNTT